MTSTPLASPDLEQPEQIRAFKKWAIRQWNPLMTPEELKAEYWRQEQVRLLDAQQSLSSPLYQAKADRLGMTEY